MLRRFLTPVVCLWCFAPLAALPQASSRQAEEFMAMVQRPLMHAVHPERVDVRAALPVGKRKDGSALTVDLYLPKQPATQTRPIALLLHGGLPDVAPIRPSEWRMYRDWGVALAQAGVVTVMLNHRLGYPQRRIDEAMTEIEQVMSWLQKSSAEYRADPRQLTAISFSAGGLLVPELARRYPPDAIRGYAMFYPLLGIQADEANPPDVAARLRFQDALPLLAERHTPLLIFRSGADEVPGLLALLDDSIAATLKADAALELFNLPKAPHAFDSLVDDERTRHAIGRAIQFAATGK